MNRLAVSLRAAEVQGNTLHGLAVVFDSPAEVARGRWETIARGAFDAVLADPATDVVAVAPDHDMSRVLGRQSAGTLRLRATDAGLEFEVDLPDTTYAADLRALVARGDIRGASFGFLPADGGLRSVRRDGRRVTEVTRVGYLRDISPVSTPAYGGTSVGLRSTAPSPDGASQLIAARARVLVGKE